MPYVSKRSKVITTYIDKHQGCPVDAIYVMKLEEQRLMNYQQIYEDFEMDEEEKLISNCLVSL